MLPQKALLCRGQGDVEGFGKLDNGYAPKQYRRPGWSRPLAARPEIGCTHIRVHGRAESCEKEIVNPLHSCAAENFRWGAAMPSVTENARIVLGESLSKYFRGRLLPCGSMPNVTSPMLREKGFHPFFADSNSIETRPIIGREVKAANTLLRAQKHLVSDDLGKIEVKWCTVYRVLAKGKYRHARLNDTSEPCTSGLG